MKRKVGIELLRIILMLMVLFLHLTGMGVDSRVLMNTPYLSFRGFALYFLSTLSLVAVDTFVLISGYCGIKSDLKSRKAINCWLEGIFYNVIILILICIVPNRFSVPESTNYLNIFGIMTTNQWWFLTDFIILSLIIPLLNSAILNTSKVALKKVILIIFIIITIPQVYSVTCFFYNLQSGLFSLFDRGFNAQWFIALYIVGASIRLLEESGNIGEQKPYKYFSLYIFLMLVELLLSYLISFYQRNSTVNLLILSYTSILTVLGSIFLLRTFTQVKIKSTFLTKVSQIGKYTFGVYLFSEHPYIRDWLQQHIYCRLASMNAVKLCFTIVITMVSAFGVGIIIEYGRRKIFDLFRVNDIINKSINKLLKICNLE